MATSNSRTQLLTPSSLRLDSRLPLELRSLSFEILPSPPPFTTPSSPSFPPALADGFSKVSHGLTTVTSSVFGPREQARTGPWSGGGQQGATGGGGGTQKGDRGTVNVEVGSAAWGERVSNLPSSSEGGIRKAGKDR
jgi:exosome complex component RRP41